MLLRPSELLRPRPLCESKQPGKCKTARKLWFIELPLWDENHNTGPYLARSLPKHTWRHTAEAYTYTRTHRKRERDNRTATTAATRNLISAFDYFSLFFWPSVMPSKLNWAWWCIAWSQASSVTLLQHYPSVLKWKETNGLLKGRKKAIQKQYGMLWKLWCKV